MKRLFHLQSIETNESGFTLLEVLVTLVLTSLIFTGIFGFLGQLGKLVDLRKHNHQIVEVEFLERYLRNSIHNAQKLPIVSEGFLQPRYLVGTKNRMTFVAKSSRGLVGLGLFDTSIQYDPQKKILTESRIFRRFNQSTVNEPYQVMIHPRLNSFAIAYGDHDSDNNTLVWQNDWTAKQRFPHAIKYTFETINILTRTVYYKEIIIPIHE